ncbi:uncharacterized protein DUF4446 [Paenibacillus methanolicus]|uniref:Uncharacterized protein DUF4446 n=2 Tax=Paenibacillus methanolicus TaxID=582686 RepID=A0A5S5C9Q3_9BACL|nr:uncharacterized protein DUF4446 [Paenibacillus methanolicus]
MMEAWNLQPMDGVTIGLAIVVLILVIRSIALGGKLKKLRKSYTQFTSGSGIEDLEHIIIAMKEKQAHQEQQHAALQQQVEELQRLVKEQKGHVGIHRYNAFSDGGSDLSFSLAILSETEEGLVLSGLHNRENTFVYAKPIRDGNSDYTLTPEEKKAINLALKRE